ncbi:hypothetical protein A2U01_0081573, partial [Trifolium medium]|nr:hypothetical protein [Trifolium medium]
AKWRFAEYALKSRSQEVRNCNGKLLQVALGAGHVALGAMFLREGLACCLLR